MREKGEIPVWKTTGSSPVRRSIILDVTHKYRDTQCHSKESPELPVCWDVIFSAFSSFSFPLCRSPSILDENSPLHGARKLLPRGSDDVNYTATRGTQYIYFTRNLFKKWRETRRKIKIATKMAYKQLGEDVFCFLVRVRLEKCVDSSRRPLNLQNPENITRDEENRKLCTWERRKTLLEHAESSPTQKAKQTAHTEK